MIVPSQRQTAQTLSTARQLARRALTRHNGKTWERAMRLLRRELITWPSSAVLIKVSEQI